MTIRKHFLILLFAILCPVVAQAGDTTETHIAVSGSLPVLLTVPHDGEWLPDTLPIRTKGVMVRDLNTRRLAEALAARLEEQTGKRPYLLIACLSRKVLDVNRSPAEATEAAEALPAYRAYHAQLAQFVADIRQRFPQGGLLLDIHGQGFDTGMIFRGTQAGLTTQALIERHGPQAIQGRTSLSGQLAARGYRVSPPIDAPSLHESRYAGGYTVMSYGSHRPDGIDAIQLEFGRDLRSSPRLPQDLAASLIAFLHDYGFMEVYPAKP